MLSDGPRDAAAVLILAHGAGAPMDSPFMNIVARGVAANGVHVLRFEFPYMAARRSSGRRGAPDREPVLIEAWRRAIAGAPGVRRIVIGGKSLGGRIASMIADEAAVAGLVCLGYPFHPPGNPARARIKHLEHLRTPALIVQGTRDSFGHRDEIAQYPLAPNIRLAWMEDGDHSFKPRASSGRTEAENLNEAIAQVRSFIAELE
ncbi:MAG TPA: alpha/beta family hydrolase [Candidatus Binataceae bacterium]|nr:alpha/beta family hydrolase [Candidatus Binataceae bacterium]